LNGHQAPGKYFLLLVLLVAILLQILAIHQIRRVGHRLDGVCEQFEQYLQQYPRKPAAKRPYTSPQDYQSHSATTNTLTWALRVEPRTLNPLSPEADAYCRWVAVPYIFEPLLVYDFNDLRMKPWLAKSYRVSDDGLQIEFELRDDVLFSDGRPLTSKDVVFTYNASAAAGNLRTQVKNVVATDAYSVTFYLEKPYFKALEDLSFCNCGILPEHIYRQDPSRRHRTKPAAIVGTSPFMLDKWRRGERLVLCRNDRYWGVKPKLQKIIYRFISDSTAAVRALRSGQVDLIIPDTDQYVALTADPHFTAEFLCLSYWSPGTPFYFIAWNNDMVFFNDRRSRLAMTHLLDRSEIVERLMGGLGRVVTGPSHIEGSQYDRTIRPWPYDPNRAAGLLDAAGWVDTDGDGIREKNGTPFRFHLLYAADNLLYRRIARLLKSEAAKVGIDVLPEPMEWSVLYQRIKDRNFEAAIMGWSADMADDPYLLWHSSQVGAGNNFAGFRNPNADALIETIRRTLNADERNELCRQLHRLIHNQQPCTFLFARPSLRIVNRRFHNVRIYKLGLKYWQWCATDQR